VSETIARMLGKLPKGDGNGVGAFAAQLAEEPGRIRAGVILFDIDRIVEKTDDDDKEARIRARRFEIITDPEDAAALQRILMRAFERRTGATVLPFELEQDVEQALGSAARDARIAAEQPVEHEGATEDWSPKEELDQVDEDAALTDGD
jgi:hypothetical protein